MYESEKKNTRTWGGIMEPTCARDVMFLTRHFLVTENYCSLVDIFCKTEVMSKLYYVRSADENVGGSVVDIFWKNGSNWQTVLRTVRWRTVGGSVVGIFWKTVVIGNCTTYGPPTRRGWYGGCLFFSCFRDLIHFCCELWRQGDGAGETQSMVSCSIWILVCVDIH